MVYKVFKHSVESIDAKGYPIVTIDWLASFVLSTMAFDYLRKRQKNAPARVWYTLRFIDEVNDEK